MPVAMAMVVVVVPGRQPGRSRANSDERVDARYRENRVRGDKGGSGRQLGMEEDVKGVEEKKEERRDQNWYSERRGMWS
jgi:hypothetical protein